MGLLPSASRMLDLVPAPEFIGLRCVEEEQSVEEGSGHVFCEDDLKEGS